MPFDALHQPAYTSAEWSVNDAPVRGSTPAMIVGIPVLYVCGTARSGSTCCIATAMTSPTSAPGWCVPALTGLLGAGVVDGQRFAVDVDLHVQVHVGVAEGVVVDVRVGFVLTVGPLRDFFAE